MTPKQRLQLEKIRSRTPMEASDIVYEEVDHGKRFHVRKITGPNNLNIHEGDLFKCTPDGVIIDCLGKLVDGRYHGTNSTKTANV